MNLESNNYRHRNVLIEGKAGAIAALSAKFAENRMSFPSMRFVKFFP